MNRHLILALLFALVGAFHAPADAVVKCACRPSGPAIATK